MSGWLIAKPYEGDAGLPTHEALFAAWNEDQAVALKLARDYSPRGSRVGPYVVTKLTESMLRGLHLSPGEAALLSADRPRI